MHWLYELDVSVLRFINETLSNSFFDALMPFASGNKYFFPAVFVICALLLWKGGARGRLCVLMLILIVSLTDGFVCNTIKHAIGRPRPFLELSDIQLHVGRGRSASMPSSHAANMFAATMVMFLYYRRSVWIMLPVALVVSYSRVYNGVHYPSDVLVGILLGAGTAVAGLWMFSALWRWAGRKWFPLWWEKVPALVNAECGMRHAELSAPGSTKGAIANPQSAIRNPQSPITDSQSSIANSQSAIDQHWLRLGYVLIIIVTLARLAYIGSGLIELSGDEAYQWTWSKHLDLSYISKPPLIAYAQFLGTHIWGDTEFGVRFFSPVIGAVLGFLLLRFFAREVNARAGFFLLLIIQATPLMALGSILLTVDPLCVLFWTAAMLAGWRAMQPDGTTRLWLWTGLWMGFGVLSKYTAMVQWLCWGVFFILWKPARIHLRRPGPYLALAINLLFLLPVVIWNQQHNWSGASHLASHNARLGTTWHLTPRYFLEFFATQSAVLNPIFFVAMIWAAIAFWRRDRNDVRMVYLFSMGAPLFLAYLSYSIRTRIFPNWIAPSVLPLFSLMVIYWDAQWRSASRAIKSWLITGLAIGYTLIVFLYEPDLVKHIAGRPLPPKPDHMTRARAYAESARIVMEARNKLLAEGKPVFIIGAHYQVTSLLSFYIPEARTNMVRDPLVYYLTSRWPDNQYYYWPGYEASRKGQNALFVQERGLPPMVDGWFFKWLKGETNLSEDPEPTDPPPRMLTREFESVKDLGQFNAYYRGRVFHTFEIYECRNLK